MNEYEAQALREVVHAAGSASDANITSAELRALLTWRMVSDPWPDGPDMAVIDGMLERESKARGYRDWVDAYHRLDHAQPPITAEHPERGPDRYF